MRFGRKIFFEHSEEKNQGQTVILRDTRIYLHFCRRKKCLNQTLFCWFPPSFANDNLLETTETKSIWFSAIDDVDRSLLWFFLFEWDSQRTFGLPESSIFETLRGSYSGKFEQTDAATGRVNSANETHFRDLTCENTRKDTFLLLL